MNGEEAKKIVEGMIKGSAKIDQMKKDIDLVVKTLRSIGICFNLKESSKSVSSVSETTYWEILKSERHPIIRFMIKCGDPTLSDKPVYSSIGGAGGVGLTGVKMVCDALPNLISFVAGIDSSLKGKLEPLLEAGKLDN